MRTVPVVDDATVERTILALVEARAGTVCPSEVARALVDDPSWRELMPRVRDVAGSLAREGRLAVTQGGAVVDIASARGPVRLGRPRT